MTSPRRIQAGSDNPAPTGPNLTNGIAPEDLILGQPILAHIDGEAVLVTRLDGRITVVGAHCTHYGGPLAEGLVTQDRDAARWPEPRGGRRVRIEHWVVAQRQGQHAAANILGRDEPYRDVPFFWTVQFGTTVCYVGHAHASERVEVESDCDARVIRYFEGGRVMAVATIGRDDVSLRAEASFAAEAADSRDARLG